MHLVTLQVARISKLCRRILCLCSVVEWAEFLMSKKQEKQKKAEYYYNYYYYY